MPGVQDTFDDIVRAHHVVRDSVKALARTRDPEVLREQLELLAKVLPAHFLYEESENGYFAHLRTHLGPRREGLVQGLIDDHRAMSLELTALLDDAPGEDWVERARAFGAALKAHEQRESRLGATPSEPGL